MKFTWWSAMAYSILPIVDLMPRENCHVRVWGIAVIRRMGGEHPILFIESQLNITAICWVIPYNSYEFYYQPLNIPFNDQSQSARRLFARLFLGDTSFESLTGGTSWRRKDHLKELGMFIRHDIFFMGTYSVSFFRRTGTAWKRWRIAHFCCGS